MAPVVVVVLDELLRDPLEVTLLGARTRPAKRWAHCRHRLV